MNWFWQEDRQIVRLGQPIADGAAAIFPSDMPEDVAQALVTIVETASEDPGVYFTFLHPFLLDNFELKSEAPDLYKATPK